MDEIKKCTCSCHNEKGTCYGCCTGGAVEEIAQLENGVRQLEQQLEKAQHITGEEVLEKITVPDYVVRGTELLEHGRVLDINKLANFLTEIINSNYER